MLAQTPNHTSPKSNTVQLVVNVIIPTIILLTLSDKSRLGARSAMLVSLAFPVGLELYTLARRRKPSMLSIISIVGILLTGLISTLGLSENWLAVRRSAIYGIAGIVLFGSIIAKRSLLNLALPRLLDMELIRKKVKAANNEKVFQKHIDVAGYAFAALLIAIAVSSFALTLSVIKSPTESAAFNSEYVRLRALSLPATTLPLLVGVTAILLYLLNAISKLTGLSTEMLVKKPVAK
jgi:hypothetical protein